MTKKKVTKKAAVKKEVVVEVDPKYQDDAFVPNIQGDKDTFQLIYSLSVQALDFVETVKVMEITGVGCMVKTSTTCREKMSESVAFAPGVRIGWVNPRDESKGRKLVKL